METAICTSTLTRVGPRGGCLEAQHRSQESGAVGQPRSVLVDDLHLIAFKDRDIDEFTALFAAMVLDDQQAGIYDLEHEAKPRDASGRSPDAQDIAISPDTQMDTRAFDRRRDACQQTRLERQRVFEAERMLGFFGPEKREGILET